jgi:hypothetical protein
MATRTVEELALSRGNRKRSAAREKLLQCGAAATLVYAAADLIGGLMYRGYSFSSQMVSELMAVGAPSERFVDPLFLLFDGLVIAFAVGVYREGLGASRRLEIVGALLAAYGVIGLSGPTLFEMHPRGSAGLASDTPHIVLTAVLVLLNLTAMGFAAFALGKRFRTYSLITLLTVVVFGTLAAPSGARLAAGEPTPGFGIIERINIYASTLWIAVLSIALLRRPNISGGRVRA